MFALKSINKSQVKCSYVHRFDINATKVFDNIIRLQSSQRRTDNAFNLQIIENIFGKRTFRALFALHIVRKFTTVRLTMQYHQR